MRSHLDSDGLPEANVAGLRLSNLDVKALQAIFELLQARCLLLHYCTLVCPLQLCQCLVRCTPRNHF